MIAPTWPTPQELQPALEKLEANPGSVVLIAVELAEAVATSPGAPGVGSAVRSAKHCVACWKRPDYNFVVAFTTLTTGNVWSLRL